MAGVPTTPGFPSNAAYRSKHDAAVVERLRRAGAVILGKTNIPVNMLDWQSVNAVYGTTNNPWDLKRTPGGSSRNRSAFKRAQIAVKTAIPNAAKIDQKT